MTAKSPVTGVGYVEFQGVDITAVVRNFDAGIEEVTSDATSGNDGLESAVKIRDKVAPTCKILITNDAAGLAILAVLRKGQTGTLTWGYDGNTSGKPKWSMTARVTKSNIPHEFDKELAGDVAFMNTAAEWITNGDAGGTF